MIKKFFVQAKPTNRDMQIHMYLPDDYQTSQKRYPVFYMYDGHNLFYDEDATYGTSWGLKEYLDSNDLEMIVVGMECDHEGNNRLQEYCPYSVESYFAGFIDGYGDQYMDYVVHDLKPMIDANFPTLPQREYTGIGGSSMGGLMSLYTILKYNDVFSKAACLSPSSMICQKEMEEEFSTLDFNPDTKVYIDFGSEELGDRNFLIDSVVMLLQANRQITSKGLSCYPRLVKGENHCEASWRKSLSVFMNYLWKK